MTKKHFIKLAAALKAGRPDPSNTAALKMWHDMVRSIANVCADTNANFRHSTFLDACGYEN